MMEHKRQGIPTGPEPPTFSHRLSLDLMRGGSLEDQRSISTHNSQRPETQQRSLGKSILKLSDDQSIQNANYQAPSDLCKLVQNVYFCKGGDAPKIHMPYQTNPGHIPRRVAIERRRREYLNLDIEQLLADKGINSTLLIPRHLSKSDKHATTPESPYLPLEMFDNEDYDCRTPEEWLALGQVEGSHRKPIPAKALLPEDDVITSDDLRSPSSEYCWHLAGVLDYNKEKGQYLVEKVHQNSKETDLKGMISLVAGSKHWVPRIRLYFSAEDPRVFVERLQFALRYREYTEGLCIYHLSVNCMPICPGTPSITADTLQPIKSLVLSTPGLRPNDLERYIGDLEKEIKPEYDWTMNRMVFDQCVMSSPGEFSHITLPQKESAYVPQKGCVPVPFSTYGENKAAFLKKSLFRRPEVISVLTEIWSESRKVAIMKLFNMTSTTTLHLYKFKDVQSSLHRQINSFLRKTFVSTLTNIIRSNLPVSKGPFNVNVSSWDVYRQCSLRKLMTVVRLNLQDSLRFLVQDSLASLTQLLLDACHSVLTCSQDLVWGNDLINSPYLPKTNPVFAVDLVLDQTGVHYSTPLENFETSIVNLFDQGVLATHNIPQLDKFVLQKLVIRDVALLETVNLWEPEVRELRKKISSCLVQAIIPLKAYAAEYEKHLELYNLDMKTFLKSHNEEQTFQEVRKEVEHHLQDLERIKHTLPQSIVIGPFAVLVEPVRQSLIKKKKALASALLDHFAMSLQKQLDNACEAYNLMNKKLHENPKSIEELTEKRQWMKQIPEELESFKEPVGRTMSDYEMLEEFFYILSDEDFNKKWTTIQWPQQIMSNMEAVVIQHVEDEERFRKIHLADQDTFEGHLDSLEMLVAGFANQVDIEHAHEMSNKVQHTSKQLKECQTMAQTYNTRECLLGMPVTNYDRLYKLIKDFQPFDDLWKTTSNWLYWHERWLNDPLSCIDPEHLEHNVTDALKTMHKCLEHFKDIPDCQQVANVMRHQIEDFCPYVPIFRGLRNPGMRSRHWVMLSERTQMEMKPKDNMTFSDCLELGIQNYVDDIAHVDEMARNEYSVEQALEKMEHEWLTVHFDVLPYKETGTYILKSPDEVSQLLDDHIVMMQSISLSPFKNTFKGRINTLENKLNMTRDVLKEWLMCQSSWLYLEPIFSSDDINQQLPAEGRQYKRMDQTWRRVMKIAFDNRKVIELCPDAALLAKLKMCNKLLEQVQKGLSGYLETKRDSFPQIPS